MKKITLLMAFCFIGTLSYNAQVVSTSFGTTPNENEWINGLRTDGITGSLAIFDNAEQIDNVKVQTRSGGELGRFDYTGTYSGTLSSTDVIYFDVRRVTATPRTPEISKWIVSYKQNGGAIETQEFTIPTSTSSRSILKATPGFTDGATLSELTVSLAQDDGVSPAFDVFRLYEFSIGPDPTLSTRSNIIEGATVFARDGEITVKGADLDAVYAITGQQVKATGLSSGVYIVRISKNSRHATVKVAL